MYSCIRRNKCKHQSCNYHNRHRRLPLLSCHFVSTNFPKHLPHLSVFIPIMLLVQNVLMGSQPLSIAYFTYHSAYEVCSCRCVGQKPIPFYCEVLFCCINVPWLFSHSPTEGYVDVSNVE